MAENVEAGLILMADQGPASLAELLAGGKLARLGAEARRRRDLTERIRALLPADAALHLVTASTLSTGELVLTMDASVWAARVRYLAGELGAERLKVKVRPTAVP
jgi:hypothetical protein